MDTLSQVTITRLSDGVRFEGYAWTGLDGMLEAFWWEDETKHTFFFKSDGTQARTSRPRYELKRQEL